MNRYQFNKKVLILCRHPEQYGGVTNYCNSIFKHYASESFIIERFVIGRRPGSESDIKLLIITIYDCVRFFIRLFDSNIVLVHLNPSLGAVNLIRESIFLLIAKFHSKFIFVFWHGWNKNTEKWIENHRLFMNFFRISFDSADASAVLASSFLKKLRKFGFNQPIFIETTTFNNDLIDNYRPEKKVREINGTVKLQVLFLSRLEVSKGIIELIDAFKRVQPEDRKIELLIAGDGPDSDLVKQYVKKTNDTRIKLLGYLTGREKRKVLEQSHIFCLPTSYGEGLPVSILEAMAFGMPVLTTPVGGIPDIFVEREHGYYINPHNVQYFADQLSKIIADKKALVKISINNIHYSRQQFMASLVMKRLDKIYSKITGRQ